MNQIVPFDISFTQDPRGYHLKQFTISCKSDSDIDIMVSKPVDKAIIKREPDDIKNII